MEMVRAHGSHVVLYRAIVYCAQLFLRKIIRSMNPCTTQSYFSKPTRRQVRSMRASGDCTAIELHDCIFQGARLIS